MLRACAAAAWTTVLVACASAPAVYPAPRPACPRAAAPDANGRCTCDADHVAVLGACLSRDAADAWCGPPAQARDDGSCAFRKCPAGSALDLRGGCVADGSLVRGSPRCAPGAALVVDDASVTCASADAACPRGTVSAGATCASPPSCPAGSLWDGRTCEPLVEAGPRGPLVRLGAWVRLALGVDHGRGSEELCRPLEASSAAFGLTPGQRIDVVLHVVVDVPGQDVSRAYAAVHCGGTPSRVPEAPVATARASDAEKIEDRAVQSLVEALRGLGGESSVGTVEVEVRCSVGAGAGAAAAVGSP